MSELCELSLTDVRDRLAEGRISCEQAVAACLQRIESTEPDLKAMISVQAGESLAAAREMDQAGPDKSKPLWGVPITVKDVIATKDVLTTCGSRVLADFKPVYDAYLVKKLKDAGAIIVGKCNMDEFAMGSSTENSAQGPSKNPWDAERVPGGSSGGSAVSVAAGQCFGSIGTDTGGSIRQPASFCGVVGLKPTYGRVSRFGLIAYGSSLDQAGPLTRTVADCALLLQVIAGHDPADSTSVDRPVPNYLSALGDVSDLKGKTIGLPEEYWGKGLDPEVDQACQNALQMAEQLGATLKKVSLPHTAYAISTYYILAMAEASSNLARFDGVRYGFRAGEAEKLVDMYVDTRSQGFGEEVQRRIMLGTYVLSAGYYDAYYRKAAQVRRLIQQDFLTALNECDLLCAPACPTVAFKLGENTADPLQMYLTDIFTISLNLSGLPGLCLPVGLGGDSGMPVGLQFFGGQFEELSLLQAAHLLEQKLGLNERPDLAG